MCFAKQKVKDSENFAILLRYLKNPYGKSGKTLAFLFHKFRQELILYIMSLDELKIGETAKVIEVNLPTLFKNRLYSMGLKEDAILKIENVATIGGTILVKIETFLIVIRKDDAKYIKVIKYE